MENIVMQANKHHSGKTQLVVSVTNVKGRRAQLGVQMASRAYLHKLYQFRRDLHLEITAITAKHERYALLHKLLFWEPNQLAELQELLALIDSLIKETEVTNIQLGA